MQRKNLFLVGEFLRSKIHEGKLEQTGLTKPARRYRIVAERNLPRLRRSIGT